MTRSQGVEGVPGQSRTSGQDGLTLIELAVVLGILGVLAALTLPAIGRGSANLQVRREAGRVAAALREARLRAVRDRIPVRVTLDRAHNTVTVAAGEDGIGREIVLPPELHLVADAGGEVLTFTSRGFTRDARWIIQGPAGRELPIEVIGVTGRVTVGQRS